MLPECFPSRILDIILLPGYLSCQHVLGYQAKDLQGSETHSQWALRAWLHSPPPPAVMCISKQGGSKPSAPALSKEITAQGQLSAKSQPCCRTSSNFQSTTSPRDTAIHPGTANPLSHISGKGILDAVLSPGSLVNFWVVKGPHHFSMEECIEYSFNTKSRCLFLRLTFNYYVSAFPFLHPVPPIYTSQISFTPIASLCISCYRMHTYICMYKYNLLISW